MAALDATVGGATANSYVTISQANDFMEERLATEAWSAPEVDREAALMTATRLLDQQMLWIGERATMTQALDWPRIGSGLDPLLIPVPIQRATSYYTLYLLQDTSMTTSSVEAGTVKRQKLGDTEVEFFQPGTSTQQLTRSPWTTLPTEIAQMLRPYGRILTGVNIPVLRT